MLVVLLDAGVGEICRGVEVRIHRTLDARLDNEEVVGGYVQRLPRVQTPMLFSVEYLQILMRHDEMMR